MFLLLFFSNSAKLYLFDLSKMIELFLDCEFDLNVYLSIKELLTDKNVSLMYLGNYNALS